MKKFDLKRIIKECVREYVNTYPISKTKEVSIKSLKSGDFILYNNQGPFEVVSITPDKFLKNSSHIKIQVPNVPEKWAEIKVDNNTKYFTKV